MNKTKKLSKVVAMESTTVNEVSDEQRKLFNMAMENVKSFSTNKSRKNTIGIVAIDLSLLFVDTRYQGLRAHKHIDRLIKNWDERKLSPIIVVPHPEECRFAVVDGQGRLIAATELGYETLQAIVLLDAPEDENERLKFEAEIFIGQDDEIEKVKALEKHLARVIIGDEAAIALEKMFTRYEITYTDTKGCRKAGVLGSYPTAYNMAKIHGEKCLDYIFSIIKSAGWDDETNGYATYITESLKNIWVTFPNTKDRENIHKYLSKTFRDIDPTIFASNAKSRYPMRKDMERVCTLYLEDIIHDQFGLERAA